MAKITAFSRDSQIIFSDSKKYFSKVTKTVKSHCFNIVNYYNIIVKSKIYLPEQSNEKDNRKLEFQACFCYILCFGASVNNSDIINHFQTEGGYDRNPHHRRLQFK